MPTISQITSASYEALLNEKRKPTNQWADTSVLKHLEKRGYVKRIAFGETLKETLDYRRNAGAAFLANDFQPMSLAKTDVLTQSSFDPAQILVPLVWSKGDDAKNPSENQKVAFVKALVENGIDTHDDLVEQALFAASATNGFNALVTLAPMDGLGSPGGIDASTDAFWRNITNTYLSNGTDIVAKLTTVYNSAAKGSGGMAPQDIVSGAAAQAIFEATQISNQRYINTSEADAGFKVLAFKNAGWIFSQHGDDNIFGIHPKAVKLQISKDANRQLGETQELENGAGYRRQIYTMLQLVTGCKSRLFSLTQ